MAQRTRFVPVALWIPSFEGMTRRLLNNLKRLEANFWAHENCSQKRKEKFFALLRFCEQIFILD